VDRPGAGEEMLDRIRARVRAWRATRPWLDHAVRAYDRNSEVLGGQLAGAITYFGFLSFFPLLALGFAVLGFVTDVYPGANQAVTEAIEDAFPSLIGDGEGQINLEDIASAKTGAGIFGLLGLLYSGTGWLDALRVGMRTVFGTLESRYGLVKRKVFDVFVLVLLGASLLVSLSITSMATAATLFVLDLVALDDTVLAVGTLKVVSVALAIAVDTVLFGIVLARLPGADLRWSQVRSGALLFACGFELLKLVATFLIGRTTSNPLYATFGIVVGLLVWMNFVARLTIFAAAWTATQPYSLEPGDPGEAGAGRSTGLAAATDPVVPVAPSDYEPVPVGPIATRVPARRPGWRRAAFGAAAGAGAAAWLMRWRRKA